MRRPDGGACSARNAEQDAGRTAASARVRTASRRAARMFMPNTVRHFTENSDAVDCSSDEPAGRWASRDSRRQPMSLSRRSFLNSSPLILAPAFLNVPGVSALTTAAPPTAAPDSAFPSHPADLVREMVSVAHGNPARVKELLAARPTLARAAWDWGFGDWEDAIGAASHVGNREIAETLLTHGARPTIFSAAMLGHLDTVKAFIGASPGIEATPGPHGITLLRHAMAGGARAQAVVDYLKTLPGADKRPEAQPLTAEQMAALTGE